MKLFKNIPVKREQGNSIAQTKLLLKRQKEVLSKSTLLVFPEGGRTKTHEIMDECKSGIGLTILEMLKKYPKFKVVPICLINVKEIMPKEVGQNYFKIKKGKKGQMIIGPPIDFSEILESGYLEDREKIELIKTQIRETIVSLSE